MIFRWFESFIDPFKEPVDDMPPSSVTRFYLFYLHQVWPVFAAATVVGFGVAIIEVSLFGFIGSIVIAEFASLDDARTWAQADPYVEAGVYARVEVRPFKVVLP